MKRNITRFAFGLREGIRTARGLGAAVAHK